MRKPLTLLVSLCLCLNVAQAIAQCKGSSPLDLKTIMTGYEFIGQRPDNARWNLSSTGLYFDWNPEDKLVGDKYFHDLGSGESKIVDPSEYDLMPPRSFIESSSGMIYYSSSGDIFSFEKASGRIVRITQTFDYERIIGLDSDEKGIYYTRSSNVYHLDFGTARTRQITNFSKGNKSGKEEDKTWIEKEELELFKIVKKREETEELKDEIEKLEDEGKAKKWYYGKAYLTSFSITPNGRFVIFKEVNSNKNPSTKGMDFVTNEGYAKSLDGRAKVGLKRDDQKLAIYDTQNDTVFYASTAQLPGIYDKAEFLKEYHQGKDKYMDTYPQPKGVYFHGPKISGSGRIVMDIKSYDNKDRWIAELDPEKGEFVSIDHQHDEAWIGGPGIVGWTSVPGNYGWFEDQDKIFFQSEETGFSHLYSYDLKTRKKKALTKGKFEVYGAELNNDNSGFWLVSNEGGPAERHLYSLDVESLERRKITSMPGKHDIEISPDEKWAVSRYSYSNKPWEFFLIPLEGNGEVKQITRSNKPEFEKYSWRVPEIIKFKAEDGEEVSARIYKPENAKKNGAAVIFVHGAGYLQNVHSWWSSYYREYMFHNLLTDHGYTVLDIDYRGSEGYGRDWRTGIYRHMGGKDLSDQIDGAKYLIENQGIEKERIGIYGGSYGGFITLMALFKNPGVFQGGAALRSVTDWAHYNHPYTSNILNTPEEDPKAFRQSSPIYFAEGLEDRLLMLHGMVDMNVQFQDIVRLSQRLIELEKENWELASFPIEGHGFKESSSWHDEYRRIFELFCEELE